MKSCEQRPDCGCIYDCEDRAISSPVVSAGLVRLIYRLLLVTLIIVGLVALFWSHAGAGA